MTSELQRRGRSLNSNLKTDQNTSTIETLAKTSKKRPNTDLDNH